MIVHFLMIKELVLPRHFILISPTPFSPLKGRIRGRKNKGLGSFWRFHRQKLPGSLCSPLPMPGERPGVRVD
jgi:hypothetical protein